MSESKIAFEESSAVLQGTPGFVEKDGEKINIYDDKGRCLTKFKDNEATNSSHYRIVTGNEIVCHTDPSSQDEDSHFGFEIIKPEADLSSKSQEQTREEEGDSTPNVIIIQNPEDMNINGFDPDVLSQVQKVLAESGTESSVMIVNETDENNIENKETTTYIIDLNSVEASHSTSLPITNVNPIDIQQQQQNIFSSSSPASAKPSTSVFQTLVNSNESASKTVDSFVSLSRGNMDHIVTHSSLTDTDINVQKLSVDDISAYSVSNSFCANIPPMNLIQSSHMDTSHSSPSDYTQTTATPSTSTVTTSQVAEQLIHIAKKMIEDSTQGSQKISVDESLGKIVISSPESKRSGDKSSSDSSVITMYLSSPNDLKLKLKKLKTNSPVIVMQAGEEPAFSDENKENPFQEEDLVGNEIKIEDESEVVHGAVSQTSDSLAAALSSLTSGGIVYRCSECGYSSHNKHYYKQHVDLVHNEERPYKCPHCDYAGKRRHALLEHMVVHSNQRPYSCNHCNASFRKKGHLTNHVKLHMSHRLVHCGVCNIQLPDTEAFESHLRKIHNTDKLYKCKLCEHTVVDRRAMLTHLATHNETIIFSCPKCSSYFNDETSLLNHMKDTHDIVRNTVSTESEKTTGLARKNVQAATITSNSGSSNSEKNAQPANIVCSECGFICADTQVMKKHMWVHIDSSRESGVQLKDQAASKKNEAGSTNNSAMGVLKMNVVSGMKSLPENIVYQCTSCKFTSSDNSVFIKHMLLHKTQRKQQGPVSNVLSLPQQDPFTSVAMTQSVSSISTPGTSVTSSFGDTVSKEKKTDSSVPFVFDQASGRYRCLICGYHCDFQRTIKAHIWKHSGNQNIEYPVFEQTKKPESSSYVSTNSEPQKKFMPTVESVSTVGMVTSPTQLQTLKTNPGRVIQLLPFKPMSAKYKPEDLIQVKDNIVFPGEKKQNFMTANDSINKVPYMATRKKEVSQNQLDSSPPANELPSSTPTLIIEDKTEVVVEVGIEQSEMVSIKKGICADVDIVVVPNKTVNNLPVHEGCTEPSVVVEIVDSVPSSFGLTGMKSQHGSPRVSDLEGSGNEVKLLKSFKDMAEVKDKLQETEITPLKSEDEAEENTKTKYNLRKPKQKKTEVSSSTSRNLKRTAPSDSVSSEKSSDNDSKVKDEAACSPQKQLKMKELKADIQEECATEIFSNEESDGTASSDDTVSAGESGSNKPPKSGICSSLLAVIEQLRERSRSESEKEPPALEKWPKRSSKRNKKSGGNSEIISLSEFHNIEKIMEGGGEKFRCSLCHYTSQRICNMKIHMKTHRQKKPSECSLCDFASSSPELLQEHMLLHCKVRTYACKFCPQSFNHKSTLRAHMRAHKDHEPFLCAYCVFETTNPNEYREHMHVHSGCSSRLRCPGCDYIMNSKDELTPHLMKCKGKPPESSAAVDKGNKKSPESAKPSKTKDVPNDLKTHQSSSTVSPQPTQHSCVVSGCSFSSYSLKELQDHLSIHCNPSLMVCDLCDFKALHSRSLKSHMKRHANDQRYVQQPLEQYKCNLCGYVCHHLPSLKSHMWRHASDQSYSYEFTNDVINAAIDHDSRVDVNNSQPDDPELLVQFINSESRIMEGELTNYVKGDRQRPTCWVTFRCCSCGFETINKAKLNIHMRSHSDIIQQTLDVTPRKPGYDKSNHPSRGGSNQPLAVKSENRRSPSTEENNEPFVPPKVRKGH